MKAVNKFHNAYRYHSRVLIHFSCNAFPQAFFAFWYVQPLDGTSFLTQLKWVELTEHVILLRPTYYDMIIILCSYCHSTTPKNSGGERKNSEELKVHLLAQAYHVISMNASLTRIVWKKTPKLFVSYEFIDLWTEVREWSVRPVWRLRTASKQIWLISHKKPISQLQPRMNERKCGHGQVCKLGHRNGPSDGWTVRRCEKRRFYQETSHSSLVLCH